MHFQGNDVERTIEEPSLTQICEWIVAAWDLISQDMVTKSFKVTFISNAMDGTEDDNLWTTSSGSEVFSGCDEESDMDASSDEQ
ncbi:hypothetical protein L9F63_002408 [Diploptera punctata]|uniref:DDE-1 domain-containing protein n=1 Tax=Diploptera punctata TaxID=6984 RepID=A0AAD7ZSA9_DIPPU|nr:hypothetical protein L9F63_002408 [Diploptera punctata]